MSRFVRLMIQMMVVVALYYVLSYFNLVSWYLIVGLVLLVGTFLYFQIRITDNEMYFEIVCNTNLYLRRLKKSKEAKKDSDSYRLGLAYASMYLGDIEAMNKHLARIDETRLPNQKRQLPIYIRIRARVAHEDNDLVELESLLDRSKEMSLESLVGYITALTLDLNEQSDDLVVLLKDLIPKEVIRLHIIELEYLLAQTYERLGQIEDALAIYEFIVRRGFGIQYTDLSYDRYIEIKETEEEKSISQ